MAVEPGCFMCSYKRSHLRQAINRLEGHRVFGGKMDLTEVRRLKGELKECKDADHFRGQGSRAKDQT